MKCSESWLRDWVNPKINRQKLCSDLTMAGFEVEELAPIKGSELEALVSIKSKNDHVIDISVTPNRGDCLSILGIAREIAALTKSPLHEISVKKTPSSIKSKFPVTLKNKSACPRYAGRIIRHVNVNARTPDWLKDRLITSGIKVINPIVDITNYVMLELGQPMHAFDLDTLVKGITIRNSLRGEKIQLLDDSIKELDADTLIIADAEKPLAIAGVMGGISSSVTLSTQSIFLESAFFAPETIAKQRQHYGITSESAYRFERGVDPRLQRIALERATQLILEIAGGNVESIIELTATRYLPKTKVITLTRDDVQQVLGMMIPDKTITNILTSLHFKVKGTRGKWQVSAPSYRFDILLPEDLIEEIARLYGYDKLPTHPLRAELGGEQKIQAAPHWNLQRQALSHQGYHEIVSYSFVDKKIQSLLNPEFPSLELLNPITTDLAVMRTNLWPGLVQSLLYNKNRQQDRVRLFEIGSCFTRDNKKITQTTKLAGLVAGLCFPEQWGMPPRPVDFYDVKANVENVICLSLPISECVFKPESHAALHSGQSAAIYRGDKKIGILGALHPEIRQQLDIKEAVFVFELALDTLKTKQCLPYKEPSKFPEIRRDIAILINQAIPTKAIQDTIKNVAGDWLKDVFVFDVYQGKGISPGLKSVAVALILQHPSRTLVDDEVTALMRQVTATLNGHFGAELRS